MIRIGEPHHWKHIVHSKPRPIADFGQCGDIPAIRFAVN